MAFVLSEKYLNIYRNQDIKDFISRFMESDTGNVCRVRYSVERKIMAYYDDVKFSNGIKSFVPLNKSNVFYELSSGASHFFMHLFNNEVVLKGFKSCPSCGYQENLYLFRQYLENKYCGVRYAVDIDAPKLHPEINGNLERHDFFEPLVIEQFNEVTELVKEHIEDITDFKSMFSGNGYYFILEDFYSNNQSEIYSYKKLIEERLNEVDKKLKNNGNPIEIKAKAEGWSRYYKIPFAIHRHKPRLAIPLNNNQIGNIDSEWIEYVTNLYNIVKKSSKYKNNRGQVSRKIKYDTNPNIIKNIIDKSGW